MGQTWERFWLSTLFCNKKGWFFPPVLSLLGEAEIRPSPEKWAGVAIYKHVWLYYKPTWEKFAVVWKEQLNSFNVSSQILFTQTRADQGRGRTQPVQTSKACVILFYFLLFLFHLPYELNRCILVILASGQAQKPFSLWMANSRAVLPACWWKVPGSSFSSVWGQSAVILDPCPVRHGAAVILIQGVLLSLTPCLWAAEDFPL